MLIKDKFKKDAEVIELNRGINQIPQAYEIFGVKLGSEASDWGATKERIVPDEDDKSLSKPIDVSYRTKFVLFATEDQYFLWKLGESSYHGDATYYSVIEFATPYEFQEILRNEDDKRVYPSYPIIRLIKRLLQSDYLDEKEKEAWQQVLIKRL